MLEQEYNKPIRISELDRNKKDTYDKYIDRINRMAGKKIIESLKVKHNSGSVYAYKLNEKFIIRKDYLSDDIFEFEEVLE